jgi:hypothetical protein
LTSPITGTNFLILGVLLGSLLVFNSIPAYAITPYFSFDVGSAKWYYQEHGAYVTYYEDSNNGAVNTVQIAFHSTTGNENLSLTFTETGANTGIFTFSLPIKFVSTTGNPGVPSLKTSSTDSVTVTKGITVDTLTIKNPEDPNTTHPTSPTTNQPGWSVKILCDSTNGLDADSDGICGNWETSSGLTITKPGYTSTYTLDCTVGGCPTASEKDIYVEVDWLKGHKPNQASLDNVIAAFATANPSIKLHIQVDEEIPYHWQLVNPPDQGVTGLSDTHFESLKKLYFGTSNDRSPSSGTQINEKLTLKRQVFHYAIFGHSQSSGASGIAEISGQDIFITLGNWAAGTGTQDEQAGTFMHELGHNLNLKHGGNNDINCKPNYLSVMNYPFQFSIYISNRPLDYSRSVLPTLNEASLSESVGVGASTPAGRSTVYGPPTPLTRVTGQSFDWDRDSVTDVNNVPQDINYIGGTTGCGSSSGQSLTGYNDWGNIALDIKTSSGWGDGMVNDDQIKVQSTNNPLKIQYQKQDDDIFISSDIITIVQSYPKNTNIQNEILPDTCIECKSYSTDNLTKQSIDTKNLYMHPNQTEMPDSESSYEDMRIMRSSVVLALLNQTLSLPDCVFSQESDCSIKAIEAKDILKRDLEKLEQNMQNDELYYAMIKLKDISSKIEGLGIYSKEGPLISNIIARGEILLSVDNIVQSTVKSTQSNDVPELVTVDTDNDGIIDSNDNCVLISNTEQVDVDKDGSGDACDSDEGIKDWISILIGILLLGVIYSVIMWHNANKRLKEYQRKTA